MILLLANKCNQKETPTPCAPDARHSSGLPTSSSTRPGAKAFLLRAGPPPLLLIWPPPPDGPPGYSPLNSNNNRENRKSHAISAAMGKPSSNLTSTPIRVPIAKLIVLIAMQVSHSPCWDSTACFAVPGAAKNWARKKTIHGRKFMNSNRKGQGSSTEEGRSSEGPRIYLRP